MSSPTFQLRLPAAPQAIALLTLGILTSALCAEEQSSSLVATTKRAADTPLMQELVAAETGFDFTSELQVDHPLGYLYRAGFAAGGVAIGDLNGDNRPDIFCAGSAGKNALFLQQPQKNGKIRFIEVTADSPGLDGGDHWAAGCALADIDADGDLDIYICRYDAPNAAFLNDGKAGFQAPSGNTGLEISDASHTPAFADYDNDGDLDLYLLTNRFEDPRGFRGGQAVALDRNGRPTVKKPLDKYYEAWFEDFDHWGVDAAGQKDYLLRNDGPAENGTPSFTDVSKVSGLYGRGDGLSVSWWDYDLDGDLDIHIGNDFISKDRLYRNNGDGTFEDVIGQTLPHTSWFSMGSDFGDLNGDGRPEFLIADMSATNHFKQKTTMGIMGGAILRRANGSSPPQYMRNAFYINTGTERFTEAAYMSGVDSSDWTWSVLFADFDLDGLRDVYMSNGTPRAMNDSDLTLTTEQLEKKHEWEYAKHFPVRTEKNRVFRNLGGFNFSDASDDWGLGKIGVSYAAALADLDGDGDQDLVVLNVDEPASLYLNHADNPNRVAIELTGPRGNPRAVGARLELQTTGGLQTAQIIPARGFMGGCDSVQTFGLPADARIQTLRIYWPGGSVTEHKDLRSGMRYRFGIPSEAVAAPNKETTPATPLFTKTKSQLRAHSDPAYDDFQHQSLLPNQLSALGPAASWGDIDGDGDDDLFLGGGAGQAGAIYRNDSGQLVALESTTLTEDAAAEDMGAVFFDVDSDGDLDLFVASGSYEFKAGSPLLRDRLYLNDGKGTLSAATDGTLPANLVSSSCVAAADYDGDGDVDLFVGGRLTPRSYPVAPQSVLLRNDKGKLTDATAEVAEGLSNCGMVTSALWSDADGDGDPDLLVAREWGSIDFYQNDGGKLTNATKGSGFDKHSGWWNSISGADLDGDGDIDYIAGNQGLNTKYHASPKKTVALYYGDYHGTGKKSLVEAEWEGDVLYPVRGKSCSTRAMPALAQRFETFKAFATASLEEIYGSQKLEQAIQLEADTLESGVFLNAGDGTFSFTPLPRMAQIAPVFGIAIEDLDGDGSADVFLAQNFFGPQAETGRFDGGIGCLLQGKGDGTFTTVSPLESGIVITGDMTAAVAADLNADSRPDILVARNSETAVLLEGTATTGNSLAVRLRGARGNPSALGARITLTAGKHVQHREVQTGGGYLGQSSATQFFSIPTPVAASPVTVEVRWPDGKQTTHREIPLGKTSVLSPKS